MHTDPTNSAGPSDQLVVFLVFDTLRYDVAIAEYESGQTPNIQRLIPAGWQRRHTPGSFTFAAHMAFFHGFFPTPMQGQGERPFAIRFPGSLTVGPSTVVFDEPNIVAGLASRGYRTVCIGGTGFFNFGEPMGAVLPGLFQEAHWDRTTSVTSIDSADRQVAIACEALDAPGKLFLFVNFSAIHQPNCHYVPGATVDSLATHAAAFRYVDRAIQPLVDQLLARPSVLLIAGADHGTAYGEDGFSGHRVGHPVVWTVPWAERRW